MANFIFPRNAQRQRKGQSQGLGAQLSPNEAETLRRISAAALGPNNYSLKDVKTLRHRLLVHDKNGELELTSAGETKLAAGHQPDNPEPPRSFVQSFLICMRKVRAAWS